MTVRNAIAGFALAAAAAAAALTSPAKAADWPTRTVTIVVTMGAGGNTDLLARLAADHLSQKFGQSFVVENKPSAGGAAATTQVANAAPDGYTILFSPSSAVNLAPLVQKLSFDPQQKLTPVTNVATGAQFIAVKRSLGATNLTEFIAYAKANPGKLNFAAAGTNNLSHLAPLLFFKLTGTELVMVPSRSEPQAVSDLIAGNVDFYFGNASILLQYKDHPAIKLLAVGTAERIAPAMDIPSASETVPGFVFSSWNGFLVPTGTPDDIVDKLRTEITAMVQKPEVAARLSSLGVLVGGQTKAQVEATFKTDREGFLAAVKAAGVTPQ
ncbi:MAG: tripartite tricarboxylate transporter substrate binding protein [Pseudolabrys sp.]|nr:tripartite tricarboxylate transporter substrate binding protein [Pseudolabrys sp.]